MPVHRGAAIGITDKTGNMLYVGDHVRCSDGYDLIICEYSEDIEYYDSQNKFYGKLICESGDPCEDIPYALNNGNDLRRLESIL
jgi:hypothetical protein